MLFFNISVTEATYLALVSTSWHNPSLKALLCIVLVSPCVALYFLIHLAKIGLFNVWHKEVFVPDSLAQEESMYGMECNFYQHMYHNINQHLPLDY